MKITKESILLYFCLGVFVIIGIVDLLFYLYGELSLLRLIITLATLSLMFACLYWLDKNKVSCHFSVEWFYKNNFYYPPKALACIIMNLCFFGLTMLLMMLLD
ncbi:hypothetical protein [Helicobacter mesocricetorum]|uniref:hypothetical protein n=1 Tax=Helicobacter mesocricetorum TaxID=87012 RepID=UPI000CF0289C|nr:hypothetical protein [Helicobacter mesocricetorum]